MWMVCAQPVSFRLWSVDERWMKDAILGTTEIVLWRTL